MLLDKIYFFSPFLYTLQIFLSGSVFKARIVLHSKSFWMNTKNVKGSSVEDFKIKKQFFVEENLPPRLSVYKTLPLCSAYLKWYCLITFLYYFCDWNIDYWEYVIYVISGSTTVNQVCFSPLIYVAEQTGSQVMLCLPFISNLAVTVTFCSSYMARKAYNLAALVEAGFTHCVPDSLVHWQSSWSLDAMRVWKTVELLGQLANGFVSHTD